MQQPGNLYSCSLAAPHRHHAIVCELCDVDVGDHGLTLTADSVRVEMICDETAYGGMRVRLIGALAGARVPIQADVGFGDDVTPGTIEDDLSLITPV